MSSYVESRRVTLATLVYGAASSSRLPTIADGTFFEVAPGHYPERTRYTAVRIVLLSYKY
jgi:hypothetical protein